MTKIAILTDSTCDLPAETLAALDIHVVPLHIQMGTQSFLDGVNISKDTFYERLPAFDPSPTTAAPGPQVFLDQFTALAGRGYRAILALHIAEALSATVNSARTAAREFTRLPVTVLDSGQLSMGLGFLVERAAQLAQAGAGMPEIIQAVEAMMPRTHVFAAVDTLEYLRRSGRMHFAVSRLGELLRIKPLLYMNQGKPEAHRVRTRRGAHERLFSWLEALAPLERLAVLHAGVQADAEALREKARAFWPDSGDVLVQQITPVLGAHLGVGALGFACVSQGG
ncbi:MAG: DegV family protein [Anaerolineales bacterium]